ncbi:MAG: response regulator [Pyrinomonadaceae bacterium]
MRLECEPDVTAFPLVENEVFEDVGSSVSHDFDSLLKNGISAAQHGEREYAQILLKEAAAIEPRSEDAWMWLTTAGKTDLNAGRGVGMSIVKEAFEVRGGTVLVESELQRGITFSIQMPLTPQRAEPNTTQTKPVKVVEKRAKSLASLVLIVDDSASIRRQTSIFVEEQGFHVITANNGAEALELLLSGEWDPDLILSDVEMPQIDGWAFLEYVKTDANLGHIPVVMVTSLDAEEHRRRAFDLGASHYVVKPFSGKSWKGS